MLPLPTQLDDGHVVPAKACAVIIAKLCGLQIGQQRVAHAVDLAVTDVLDIQQEPVVFKSGPGDARVEHLGNVEVALFRKKAAVFVEFVHLQNVAPAQAAAEGVGDFTLPADLVTVAPGIVGAVVGKRARV